MNNVINEGDAIVQVAEDGDVVSWKVQVSSNFKVNDLALEFDIPDGVKLTGPNDGIMPVITLARGVWNSDDNKWFIGKIEADEVIEDVFEFTVEDITKMGMQPSGMFIITATATTAFTETTKADNVATLVMRLGPACEDLKLRIGTGEENKSANISIV